MNVSFLHEALKKQYGLMSGLWISQTCP